jgi:hypothetical protein
MEHRAKGWAVRAAIVFASMCLWGCSDAKPGETGGAGGSGGSSSGTAGASGSGGTGGATDAGGAGGSDGGSSADEACAHEARVSCEKYDECRPWYIRATFGDMDTCVAQYAKTLCRNRLGLADTSDTPAMREACASARKTATCAQFLDNDVALNACLLLEPGKRATGAVCGTAQQCQTLRCEARAGECGTCGGPLVEAGGACTSGHECASNLQCFDGICGRPRGVGEPCSFSSCQSALECGNGRCVVPAQLGEPCDFARPCSSEAGLVCGNDVCVAWQFAGTGEPCNNAFGRFCARAGFCRTDSIPNDGICIGAALEGEACNNSTGPFCLPWAECLQGVCKVLQYGMCN